MAIKDEIARITQAKQDFKTKLIEKGVTVSDDELISDYPPKLDLIKGGTDTTDATATANEIRKGFTAYIASGKVEGAIEDYDGSFEGGVEISGGGISIPSVTNLTCDSEGNVSWTTPNFDSLAIYNPTISYVVSVNDNVLETSNNNVYIGNYLVDGTNIINVKVKAILIENGVNTSVEYSKPVTSIVKLPLFIPKKLSATSAVLINTNAYIFGGYTGGFENTIYKFDTKAETIAKLTATLPEGRDATSAAAVGTNAYIFGGSQHKTIYKFDSTTETTTTLGITLPNKLASSSAVAKGNNIYIFGGQDNDIASRVNTIYKFDTINETLVTLQATLPIALYRAGAVVKSNNVYIFGGYSSAYSNKIYKFNTETETITTVAINLPVALANASTALIGTNAYIFGGTTGTRINTIYKFDTETETITKLDLTLPIEIDSTSAVAINGKAYIFGGMTGTRVYADTIYKFTA